MTLIIDAHEDIASNAFCYQRDYTRSAAETRKNDVLHPMYEKRRMVTTLGYPEYQNGQVALIFSTLFINHAEFREDDWDVTTYNTPAEAHRLWLRQFDFYERLCGEHPDKFRPVRNRRELQETLAPWQAAPAQHPTVTHPTGLLLLLEGAEGLRSLDDLHEYWERGLRLLGPVWSGGRWCGGNVTFPFTQKATSGGFTRDGYRLLEVMHEIGYTLDIAHMNDQSAADALEHYQGTVIASHALCRALIKGAVTERHLSDDNLRRLIERDGVLGVLPYNSFIKPGWTVGQNRAEVTLADLTHHIDHVCQLAGDALHVGLGTDFDGGFGYPAIPEELDTIADLQKLTGVLGERGYSAQDIENIMGGNWRRILEKALPES